jgi:cytochrome c nitrite reductase small subunit
MKEKGSISPLLLGVPLGLLLGVGIFTFGYARGDSYLTDDPTACNNCHIMHEQYEGWVKSSHRTVAVCNDCHAPAGAVNKYFTKALNGFNHSWAFTTGWYPDRVHITGRNQRVARASCLKCHAEVVDGIRSTRHGNQEVECVTCHLNVGHAH